MIKKLLRISEMATLPKIVFFPSYERYRNRFGMLANSLSSKTRLRLSRPIGNRIFPVTITSRALKRHKLKINIKLQILIAKIEDMNQDCVKISRRIFDTF